MVEASQVFDSVSKSACPTTTSGSAPVVVGSELYTSILLLSASVTKNLPPSLTTFSGASTRDCEMPGIAVVKLGCPRTKSAGALLIAGIELNPSTLLLLWSGR